MNIHRVIPSLVNRPPNFKRLQDLHGQTDRPDGQTQPHRGCGPDKLCVHMRLVRYIVEKGQRQSLFRTEPLSRLVHHVQRLQENGSIYAR